MLFAILAIGVIFGLAVAWSIVSQKTCFAKNVPVIQPCYPLVGNGLQVLWKDDFQRHENMKKLFDQKDKLFRLYLGPKIVLGTCDPEMAQQILTDPSCMSKPYLYDYFRINLGLFAAKAHIWKGQRKALNSTFNLKILESFIPIFSEVSKKMIDRLEEVEAGKTINFIEYASKCTMEMVCATTLGFNVNFFNEADKYAHYLERYFHMVSRRMLNIHLHFNLIYRCTKDYYNDKATWKYLLGYGIKIYDYAKEQYAKDLLQKDASDTKNEESIRKPQIFVNQIFTNTIRKFDRDEIIDNIYTMIAAGTDTSATGLSFAILHIAMYPHFQQKLYDEIVQVFPESEPDFTLEKLKRLQYVEMFLYESLRLYPVGPIILRENTAETTVCGLRVPKGVLFAIHIYNLHRRKDVWGPDADCFDPERFTPQRSASRHPFAYLTFSGGSRNCLGARYAMISIKIMMVRLLKNFRFKTNIREEDIRYKFDAILRMEGGHLVQIEKRQ